MLRRRNATPRGFREERPAPEGWSMGRRKQKWRVTDETVAENIDPFARVAGIANTPHAAREHLMLHICACAVAGTRGNAMIIWLRRYR